MYFIMRPNHYQQPIQALLLFQILIVYVEAVMQLFLSNSRQEKRRKGITVSTSKFGSLFDCLFQEEIRGHTCIDTLLTQL